MRLLLLLVLTVSVATFANDEVEVQQDVNVRAGEEPAQTGGLEKPKRPNEPRPGEASVGGVPGPRAERMDSEFRTLRDQFEQAVDPTILLHEVKRFATKYPTHREGRLMLGRVQILANDQLAAIKTMAPLLVASHPDWQPWFWVGTAYLSMGEVALARQNLDSALSKNSGSADLWVQMAVLEQEVGNHAGALQYLAIAEQIDPRVAQLHLNKAYSLERLGKYREALQAYQHFLLSDMKAESLALRPTVLRRIAAIAAESSLSQALSPGSK